MISKLVVTLLVAATPFVATAQGIIGYSSNKVGGRIELSDIEAPSGVPGCEGKFIARAFGGEGKDVYGCWNFNEGDETLTITWPHGRKTYLNETFKVTEYGNELLRKNREGSSNRKGNWKTL